MARTEDADRLETSALRNPTIAVVWEAWDDLSLPNCWLVAGCLAQTVWNERFGLPPEHGIYDVDIVYFDGTDLTETGEQAHAERISAMLSGTGAQFDVKNEARVHLWYERRFGQPIRPYRSVADAIDTFPTTATAIGLRPSLGGPEIYAPFGTADLFEAVVRPNKRQITREIYHAKVSRWLVHWPDLSVVSWDMA